MEKENLEWEEIECEHIICDEWIDFKKSKFKFPDGRIFEPYYSYSRKNYVIVVAIDDADKYICVKQYRQGIKRVTTEFCAGGIESKDVLTNNSDEYINYALNAAKRELLEETGYESSDWSFLLAIPSNATMADNYAYIFLARKCKKTSEQNLDETEYLNVHLFNRLDIDTMIVSGDFPQATHVLALLLADKHD